MQNGEGDIPSPGYDPPSHKKRPKIELLRPRIKIMRHLIQQLSKIMFSGLGDVSMRAGARANKKLKIVQKITEITVNFDRSPDQKTSYLRASPSKWGEKFDHMDRSMYLVVKNFISEARARAPRNVARRGCIVSVVWGKSKKWTPPGPGGDLS